VTKVRVLRKRVKPKAQEMFIQGQLQMNISQRNFRLSREDLQCLATANHVEGPTDDLVQYLQVNDAEDDAHGFLLWKRKYYIMHSS